MGLNGVTAGMIVEDGFRLDNGPTVLTMPNLLADAFAAAGADMADFITIDKVDPMYRACYADGSTHGSTLRFTPFSASGTMTSIRWGPSWLKA